jgi:hypothetical protein
VKIPGINVAAGSGMLSLSVAFLTVSALGIFGQALIPGIVCGIAGLALLTNRRQPAELPADVTARLERLETAVAATQQELASAQDELREITDERNFLRQLRVKSPDSDYP